MNDVPDYLRVMAQNIRKHSFPGCPDSWEVPIQVCDRTGENGGNVVLIAHLGGSGGINPAKHSVLAFAERVVEAYNSSKKF